MATGLLACLVESEQVKLCTGQPYSDDTFLLTKPSKDAFLLPIIGGIEQRGSILLVTLLYDLCDGQTIFTSYLVTTNHALHRSVPLGK